MATLQFLQEHPTRFSPPGGTQPGNLILPSFYSNRIFLSRESRLFPTFLRQIPPSLFFFSSFQKMIGKESKFILPLQLVLVK